jgi:hypothetical protein
MEGGDRLTDAAILSHERLRQRKMYLEENGDFHTGVGR